RNGLLRGRAEGCQDLDDLRWPGGRAVLQRLRQGRDGRGAAGTEVADGANRLELVLVAPLAELADGLGHSRVGWGFGERGRGQDGDGGQGSEAVHGGPPDTGMVHVSPRRGNSDTPRYPGVTPWWPG